MRVAVASRAALNSLAVLSTRHGRARLQGPALQLAFLNSFPGWFWVQLATSLANPAAPVHVVFLVPSLCYSVVALHESGTVAGLRSANASTVATGGVLQVERGAATTV